MSDGKPDWKSEYTALLRHHPLDVVDLAAALLARGWLALDDGGACAGDELLRGVDSARLLAAVLWPGVAPMGRRLDGALRLIDDVDDALAEEAERAIAGVIDDRDGCALREHAARAIGRDDVALSAARELEAGDRTLADQRDALEYLAHLGTAARARSPLGERSAWRFVPPLSVAPADPALSAIEPPAIDDNDLVRVLHGDADRLLERRVAGALAHDPVLQTRFDSIAGDLAAFEEPVDKTVPVLVVRRILARPSVATVTAAQRAAADGEARFEPPPGTAPLLVFDDGAELHALAHEGRWVVLLYRVTPHAGDGIDGPVESHWHDGEALGATLSAGEVTIRYGDAVRRLRFDVSP